MRIEDGALIGVIGAGTMGSGIAQVAATAGHPVLLYDAVSGAAEQGRARIAASLRTLHERGKLTREAADGILARITPCPDLAGLAQARVVVEAIVEDLEVKAELFGELEKVVSETSILATNTSSISITAIAARLARPQRLAGFHFFNPATHMRLVEVVSGRQTSPACLDALVSLAQRWGKIAVRARSNPGFIVNRVARPFYGEALRLLEESVADPATIDALMRESGGFRMGPFELMDLIGNDVNYAVTKSVFEAFYGDPRFRPSHIQLELVRAGQLGRKSGAGFYSYREDNSDPAPQLMEPVPGVSGWTGELFSSQAVERDGIRIAGTDGRTAARWQKESGRPTILYDLMADSARSRIIGFAASPAVPASAIERFVATLSAKGKQACRLADWPGLVVFRTVAMLSNEAFEAVVTGVASEADVDNAMVHGLNYPLGPLNWARRLGARVVLDGLDHLLAATGDPRYRASMGLRMAVETELARTTDA